MSETAQTAETPQTDNALIRRDHINPAKTEETKPVYDANARNRFTFQVLWKDGKKYETSHVFNQLGDERYIQWQREFHIKGSGDDVSEEAREASVRLWDETIHIVEKITYPDGVDFRPLIPFQEKIEAVNAFLSVAISLDDTDVQGDRQLGMADDESQIVLTETWFNNQIATQTHKLKAVSIEWQKKYSRIQGKRFKQEKIGGLRRKAKIEFIPQDDKLGELYDEMKISATGFADDQIPLRFKTLVIHHLFAEKLDEKK